MIPLWLWTAFAGLAVGMAYAWVAKKKVAAAPRKLTPAAVEEITALIEDKRTVQAIKLLRLNTGNSLLDAKNRVDDWRPDEERAAAR